MEVEIIKPMWYAGQPTGPGLNGAVNPVIDLPPAEAVYLESIGRVRRIETASVDVEKVSTKGKKK